MINSLNHDEILNLSVDDLAHRMDSIFFASTVERYGKDFIERSNYFEHRPTVSKILSTNHLQQMAEEKKRSVCYLTFNCLLQMEYTEFTCAASNHYIYGNTYDENISWLSPSLQIRNAALK